MANSKINKVVYGTSTLIDLTSDTVTPYALLKGRTAHTSDGAIITGTATITDPDKTPSGLVDGTAVNFYDASASFIRNSVIFGELSSLRTVTLPNVSQACPFAFKSCRALESVSIDKLESIPSYCFGYCTNLKSVYFPNVTSIQAGAFDYCTMLSTVKLPKLSGSCSNKALFTNCYNVRTLEIGDLYQASTAFGNLSNVKNFICHTSYLRQSNTTGIMNWFSPTMETISLPDTISMANAALANCTKLTSVYVPKLVEISPNGFLECHNLSKIELPSVTNIARSAFAYCKNLSEIYLLNSTYMATLANSYVFTGTPFERGVGSIYVPAVLYSIYINDGVWSWFKSRIFKY